MMFDCFLLSCLVDWCNCNSGFCSFLVSLVSCGIAAWNTWLIKKIEQEHKRPCVVVMPRYFNNELTCALSIKNVGGSSARNIMFSISPSIANLSSSIPIINVNTELEISLGFMAILEEENPSLKYTGTIHYKNAINEEYEDKLEIDFSIFKSNNIKTKEG